MIPEGSRIVAGCRMTPGEQTHARLTDPGGVAQISRCATPPGSTVSVPVPPGAHKYGFDHNHDHDYDEEQGSIIA
jgi:hypothetical protein